jgi:hypothetical protein
MGQTVADTAAGWVFCLNPKCQAELFATYHDSHNRLYFLAGAVRIFVRHPFTMQCPKCAEHRRWGDKPKRAATRLGVGAAA